MREQELDKELMARITAELDASVTGMDPAVQARLRESRRQAVSLVERRPSWFFFVPRWVTASSLATVAVVAVALSLWFRSPQQTIPPEKQVEDIEVLTAQGHLEMYEDLEFYRWLADAHDNR